MIPPSSLRNFLTSQMGYRPVCVAACLLWLLANPASTTADVFRCRLDNGELLYTDLGCLNADTEQQYEDIARRVRRKQPVPSPSSAKRAATPTPERPGSPHYNAQKITSVIQEKGFINYDHYHRSLINCRLLQPDTDTWLNNRCDAALAIAELEPDSHASGTGRVSVTSRESVDLSTYHYLDTSRSSTVRGIWFRDEEAHLIIKVDAAYYAYCGVNRPLAMQLALAPSISAYLHSHIKGFYDC